MKLPLLALTVAVSTTAILSLPATAARRAPAGPQLKVVTSGSEQALQLGATVLSRPFGAQLIDRMTVTGRYPFKGGHYFLVEGQGGSECPARYVVVQAPTGQTPTVSAPFGTCSTGASASARTGALVITMPGQPGGGSFVRYAYAQGAVKPIAGDPEMAEAAVAPPLAQCVDYGTASAAGPADYRTELDRSLPTDWRKRSRIAKAEVSQEQLRGLVSSLACLATWPGAERSVTKAAVPLFSSSRYGKASFAALDTTARDLDSDPGLRANARAFAANMHFLVDRREAF
ncbi:hypothetical protein [Sphingomonas crocodyli]|uniref:DUF4476 domain-containing protein n=1 Tax=Sphingomonas crocodyli TaxID=1979270 RepID=A0A437M6M3_9SPHN|nr:hypothetical protein [Sphingomonas crocodyli]RVT93299.1 hypothetical protein EOD43_05280 [Sphingomonas crocodyli]